MQRKLLSVLVAGALAVIGASAQAATGPSSSATPYVTSTAAGVDVTSILTVGDAASNGYRMVGIPDGLGAYDNGNGTFTVLMNHELGATEGIARAHGAKGAFVSEWVINKSDFTVISGNDLATQHNVWNSTTSSYVAATTTNSFARLCSADLPAASAFYNATTGMGTQSRIFMNGEEAGNEGRAYAFIATGTSKGQAYELPKLGKMSWENSVANPYAGNKTIVIGLDDSTPGQVYVYSGNKTNTGSDIERAGLTNGTLAGIKVNTANAQGNAYGTASGNLEQGQINGSFTTVAVDTLVDGTTQQAAARAAGITEFARPEDGHWADAKTFYFVTTGADPDNIANVGNGPIATQTARLYKLTFADGVNGEVDYASGQVNMVLDSSSLVGTDGAAARSFDNMVVADNGDILIQEDPGNTSYIAKTWLYKNGVATQILESDRTRFLGTGALTQDEESSGIIEVTSILGRNDGKRYFLADMQAHYGIAGELVQGGQLYMVSMPVPEPESYAMFLAGLGLMGVVARRRKAAR